MDFTKRLPVQSTAKGPTRPCVRKDPNIPECQKYLDEGSHRRLYTGAKTPIGAWPHLGRR